VTRLGVVAAFALASLASLAPRRGDAQQPPPPTGVCQFQFSPMNPADPPRVNAVQQPSGQYNSFVGGRFRGVCPAQSLTVIADSLEYYGDTKIMFLIGDVHYEEPRLTLDAQRVTYWQLEEHVRAERNVDATLPSGTNLKGPTVDYYRAVQGIRAQSRMVATGRPTIRIVERDSTGRPGEPIIVVANTVSMDADSLVYASGKVELTRPDVVARGDSAYVDNGRQYARLMRAPVIEGKGERAFTLTGRVIDIFGRDRALERAISIGDAKAVSEDATITSDTLDFRMADGKLQQAFAWGASRAHVTSPTYDILADSLDVRMPGQRVHEVFAVRGAYAESEPDSTKLRSEERDWLRGDTIIARFDTSAAAAAAAQADTGRNRVAIRELVARGAASSFYQMPPQDTSQRTPAINYVRGREITVAFLERQVSSVTVTDQAAGVYLEPGVADQPATGGTRPATGDQRAQPRPPTDSSPPTTPPPRTPARPPVKGTP
jgi:lipopolysaccharide export system protein LptA